MKLYRKQIVKRVLILCGITVFLAGLYSNCAPPVNFKDYVIGADGFRYEVLEGSLTVGQNNNSPPLDLFFIVDNSGSMLGHQINLGSAFSSIFTNNSSTLSNFNTRIFLISTASTIPMSYISEIPSRAPSSITTVPSPTDPVVTDIAAIPGAIYGNWMSSSGTYPTAPYNVQFQPASVLDFDSDAGMVTPYLSVSRQGAQSQSQYNAAIATLTQKFQNRIAFLNPTNQLAYGHVTDVSSGLCSMARLMQHPANFINPGDSAAFVIISDDNDRLNDRNANNNQCIDSMVASNQVIDGYCGHYESDYSYFSSASVKYQYDSKFSYVNGTKISYQNSESCKLNYNPPNSYNYTWTFTAIRTKVSYTSCNLWTDGTCVPGHTQASQVDLAGNLTGTGSACAQNLTSSLPNWVPGTSYTCASDNLAGQTGASGVDSTSTNDASWPNCSSSLLATLQGTPNTSSVACQLTTHTVGSTTISNQPVASCTNYCGGHLSQYPGCTLTQTTANFLSFQFPQSGLACNSTCPNSSQCGTSTIAAWVASNYGATAACSAANSTSTITVQSGTGTDFNAIGCSTTNINGIAIKNASGQVVCSSASTVAGCILTLQTGTPSSFCAATTSDTSTLSAPVNVGCSTACANAGLICTANTGTLGQFLADQGKLCVSSSNGGQKSLPLVFRTTASPQSANCTAHCSDTLSGSCDGLGWGAADGSTVSDYINHIGGANTCSSVVAQKNDSTLMTILAANQNSTCTLPSSPFFFASDSAHPNSATNYVAGDVNHNASDFDSFIVSQSKAIFGNIPVATAAIGHLSSDTSLYGTDVSTDYFNLVSSMGSNQVSSVTGNYSAALGSLSQYINKSIQNSFSLPIAPSSVVFAVSVLKNGSWTPIDSSLWTWAGQTLSISASAQIQLGDQIQYLYHN